MRIFLFDFWNVVNSSGGSERVLSNMANELTKRGYDITVVCCDPKNGSMFFPLNEKVKFINLNGSGKFDDGTILLKVKGEILRAFKKLDKDKLRIEKRYTNILGKLKYLIVKEKPDVIITYDPNSLMVLKSLLHENTPTIAMLHMQAEFFFYPSMSKTLLKSFKNVECIQTLTKKDIELVRNYSPDNIVKFIPNCVYSVNNDIDRAECKFNIINVGRIDKNQKCQLNLIQAFNKIKNTDKKWKVTIIGGCYSESHFAYKNEILKYISDNNLDDRVALLGEVKNISKMYQTAEIFVFPSAYEGMPLALTEAMAAGLPVIGYKSCPSVNELIVDGVNGFLCEDGIDDFAEKLKILMQDAELRKKMGQNARESMKQFAPKKIWDEWEDLINKVVEESKK